MERMMLGVHEAVPGDNPWQRRARRLQSEWRERQGLAAGLHRGVELGSRLTPEGGQPPVLRNYMTPAARRHVLDAVADAPRTGALLSRPRLWVDLLSSQPACFNLFGDLADGRDLATRVWSHLEPDLVAEVHGIDFEHSPGRSDPRLTGNRSAFDVFVQATGPRGRGFVGIEVKYAEDMKVRAATDRGYEELARGTGVYREEALEHLLRPPLQQLLLDHLLALRMVSVDSAMWDWGKFVVLYPSGNTACADSASRYEEGLRDASTFGTITFETYLTALAGAGAARLAADLSARYLGTD